MMKLILLLQINPTKNVVRKKVSAMGFNKFLSYLSGFKNLGYFLFVCFSLSLTMSMCLAIGYERKTYFLNFYSIIWLTSLWPASTYKMLLIPIPSLDKYEIQDIAVEVLRLDSYDTHALRHFFPGYCSD